MDQMSIFSSYPTELKKSFRIKMRREGRQHGVVRTYSILPPPFNPRPNSRVLNKLDGPPTAGVYTKVQSKPTNHSKFTGRCCKPECATCHLRPACKSKAKSKGTCKSRVNSGSDTMLNNYSSGLRSIRGSATRILSDLSGNYGDDEDGVYDYELPLDEREGAVSIGVSVFDPTAELEVGMDSYGSGSDDDGEWFFVQVD